MPVSSATVLPNCKTSAVSCGTQLGARNARETSAEGKNHRKSSQMSGNDRSWLLKVGIGRVTPVTCDVIT
jgi:hypothetical protein